ncbi:MAG: endonuclease/exonuclease/phosphatase family protein [Mastigocoleus sp.]
MHIPNFPKATSNDNLTINVMSFNILFKNDNYDELVKMVNNNSPDIIGLQEVFPTKASKIKKLFLSDYPYQTFNPFKNYYTHNVALLSRFPIIDTTILPYKEMERGLRATLDIGGGKQIQVIVAHLVPNYPSHEFLKLAKKWYSRRLAEASYLQKIVKNRNFPIVMMCDCNFTDTSEAYSRINSVMDDSFYQAGWGFGHSFKGFVFPLGRIDYIWNTRELRAIDAYVAEDAGSDHLPIMAKLSFSR